MFSYSSFLFQNHLSQNTNLSLHFQFLPQPEPDCKAHHKQHFSLSFQIIQCIHRCSVVHQLEIYVISLNRIVFGRLRHISERRIFCHILLLRHLNVFELSTDCRVAASQIQHNIIADLLIRTDFSYLRLGGCGDRFTHIALDNERRIAFVLIERRKIDGRIHAVIENYIALDRPA